MQLVVLAATLYPLADQIAGVGGLEIGALGGALGAFGIANEDVRMRGGGTCDSELCSLHLRERHSHRGFGLD
jgi:hypothetical protein